MSFLLLSRKVNKRKNYFRAFGFDVNALPATSLSGTKVTWVEERTEDLVGVFRRFLGGLPSSLSDASERNQGLGSIHDLP